MLYTPYSPYVKEREILDNFFSKGWGFHFPPSEEYVIDCHAHCQITSGKMEEIIETLDSCFSTPKQTGSQNPLRWFWRGISLLCTGM